MAAPLVEAVITARIARTFIALVDQIRALITSHILSLRVLSIGSGVLCLRLGFLP